MSGATGVMTVILLETAVGGLVVLWLSGVWGKVRRGYFLLIGGTVALCALGAWLLLRGAAEPSAVAGSASALARARTGAALFTGLALGWQLLLLAGQQALARVTGILAALSGVAALVAVALLPSGPEPVRAVAELTLGALFLGSTLHGLLLGHWYLVERRLTNRYMVISAWWYIAGVVAAVGAVALSAQGRAAPSTGVSPLLAIPGFSTLLAGGLVAICALIAGFVWKLAGEGGRSIQAATGMFYLAVIMAFSAELSAKVGFF